MKRESDLKKISTACAILVGTVIGAGFLGIPSVVSKSGFYIGLFHLVIIGLVVLLLNLMFGEISLRTKGNHQLTGYASKYLGRKGKKIMMASLIFEVYAAALAYLIGVSQSLSFLFLGEVKHVLLFGIVTWIIMSIFISKGVKELKQVLDYGTIITLLLILGISLFNTPYVSLDNLKVVYWNNLFVPYGVILFAYLGFSSLPEVSRYLKGREGLMKKSLLISSIVPMITYIIFTIVMVGVYGTGVSEISTFSLGKFVIILGIVTMATSYIALSVALKDMFMLDYEKSWRKSWFYVIMVPLIIFALLEIFGFDSFTKVLSVGGVICGGSIGILILLMFSRARKTSSRNPEYKLNIPNFVLWIVGLLFTFGVIYEVLRTIGIL